MKLFCHHFLHHQVGLCTVQFGLIEELRTTINNDEFDLFETLLRQVRSAVLNRRKRKCEEVKKEDLSSQWRDNHNKNEETFESQNILYVYHMCEGGWDNCRAEYVSRASRLQEGSKSLLSYFKELIGVFARVWLEGWLGGWRSIFVLVTRSWLSHFDLNILVEEFDQDFPFIGFFPVWVPTSCVLLLSLWCP